MPLSSVPIVAASVDLSNESNGVFVELLEPSLVVQGLQCHSKGLIGALDDPNVAAAWNSVRSFTCPRNNSTDGSISDLYFENRSDHAIVVQWMDEQGQVASQWTILSGQSQVLSTEPGQLFVLSLDTNDTTTPCRAILGACRVLGSLPSHNCHFIAIDQYPNSDTLHESCLSNDAVCSANSKRVVTLTLPTFLVSYSFLDDTRIDALTVAVAALELRTSVSVDREKTAHTLLSVIHNIVSHPEEDKFKRLRTSNRTVQRNLVQCRPAMNVLLLLGFELMDLPSNSTVVGTSETHADTAEQYLVLNHPPNLDQFRIAQDLLQIVCKRLQAPSLELAPPAPWQHEAFGSSSLSSAMASSGTHFLTPEERWERAEHQRARRNSRGGRRPAPGQAPSSRGRWGR